MGVDRIVTGPPSTAGTSNYDSPGALVADQQNGTLAVMTQARILQTMRTRLLTLQEQTALTAITTAQTLLSMALNAGALNVKGRTLRIRGSLIYSTTSTNVATISFALKLGTVTLFTITTAATNTAASTGLPINFDFTLSVATVGNAAASAIEAHGQVNANISANTPAAAIATYLDTNTAVVTGVDLTVAETLAITIAASAAVPSAQLLLASVDLES